MLFLRNIWKWIPAFAGMTGRAGMTRFFTLSARLDTRENGHGREPPRFCLVKILLLREFDF
ncbi:MAG: hypothetical protein LBF86_07890 [Helicobacteraceae bacterium]|nr:hypothetical protein [Helicobacteraceae bacterium]